VAIIAAIGALSLAANFPGHLSYDSVVQFAEGKAGVYGGGHPPAMSWLLGIAAVVGPGAAPFVIADTALIFAALCAFVLLGRAGSWLTVLLALALAPFPQLLIYPAIVWKDVLFAGSAVAGFACLAWAAALWPRRRRRYGLLAAGLLLLTLGAMVRQNGAVLIPFAAAAVAWLATGSSGVGRWRRGLAHGAAFAAASALLAWATTSALAPQQSTAAPSALRGQWEALQTYDIVSALVMAPRTRLIVFEARAPWLSRLLRTHGVAAYSPQRADTLEPVLDEAGAHGDNAEMIAAQWRDLIERDPALYLRVRAKAFEWVLQTPDKDSCAPIFTGVEGPAEEMAASGLRPREDDRDKTLADYAISLADTPLYAHPAYGFVGAGLIVVLLLRRRPADVAVAAMIAGALAFALTFAVISISCDYRYLYALDLSVIAAALYAASTGMRTPRNERHPRA